VPRAAGSVELLAPELLLPGEVAAPWLVLDRSVVEVEDEFVIAASAAAASSPGAVLISRTSGPDPGCNRPIKALLQELRWLFHNNSFFHSFSLFFLFPLCQCG